MPDFIIDFFFEPEDVSLGHYTPAPPLPEDTDSIPEKLLEQGIEYLRFRAFEFEAYLPAEDDSTYLVDAYLNLEGFLDQTSYLPQHNVILGDGLVIISSELINERVQCTTSYFPNLDISYGTDYRVVVSAEAYKAAWERIVGRIATVLSG